MKLFEQENIDVLPYDGSTVYYGKILNDVASKKYLDLLLKKGDWKNDEAVIFGKYFITKRKVAWYGDEEYSYTYSNTRHDALLWTPELLELKKLTEELTGYTFNSCLLNLYHDGDEGMGWHSDDEKSLAKDSAIASLSLGAERKFMLRHKKTKETISLLLETGSLLLMKENTQANWLHSVPKTKKVKSPRINLTFRKMLNGQPR
jgi:alkylated DNA repair dioxygenase AlkB